MLPVPFAAAKMPPAALVLANSAASRLCSAVQTRRSKERNFSTAAGKSELEAGLRADPAVSALAPGGHASL